MKTTEYINSKIIKYQNPAQGIQRRDNTYIQPPIDKTPIIRTDESGKPWNELSTTERASLNVRQGRNPITSKPIARGNLEISSPEFDIMAGIRGIPFDKLLGKAGKTVKRVGKDYTTIAKDAVGSPKRFIEARRNGTYPLTYKERRAYLENAHKVGDQAVARVDVNNKSDYLYRVHMYPNVDHPITPKPRVNTKYTFNSKSYKNFDDVTSNGVNSSKWNINSHIDLRRSPNSKYLKSLPEVGTTTAHEIQHSYQKYLPDISSMSRPSKLNGAGTVNDSHIASPILQPLKRNVGEWNGDPLELNSEITAIRAGLNAPRYNLMSPAQQETARSYVNHSFKLADTELHTMLDELGKLGYRNGGKL